MANVINGRSVITGTMSGSWMRGLSAYDLAVAYQGFKGNVVEWLESLKAFSPVIGEITQTEDGISFTITDEDGEHLINLRNGLDITVTSTEQTENGIIITFSDGNTVSLSNGPIGPKGENGRDPEFLSTQQGVIYWKYTVNDNNWKQLIDLSSIIHDTVVNEYKNNPPVVYVDELPDPANALEGVIYIVRIKDEEEEP